MGLILLLPFALNTFRVIELENHSKTINKLIYFNNCILKLQKKVIPFKIELLHLSNKLKCCNFTVRFNQ